MSKFIIIFILLLFPFPCFASAETEYTWYREILGYTSDYWLSEMEVDKNGNLWVLDNDKVFHFDGNIWQDFTDKAGGAKHISLSPDGVLWFADRYKLIRFDGSNWHYFEFDGGEIDGEESRFSAGPDDTVWFCKINQETDDRSLVRFSNSEFEIFNKNFLNPDIGVLTATKNGGVWIHYSIFYAMDCIGDHCPKGVSHFDGETLTNYLENDTLPGSGITWMALSPVNNDVYGLCSGNVVKFSDGKWEIINKGSYNGIMVNGGDGNIWQGLMGWYLGYYLMCLKNDTWINYDISEIKTMLKSEIRSPASHSLAVTSDGSVWMSFQTGILRINSNSLNVITSVKEEKPVEVYDKLSCYPNPFNSSATIKYYLDKDSPVNVEIYNSVGQKVRDVLTGKRKQGFNIASWNGTNNNGERVATGFYTVVVKYSGKLMSRKILFLK